MGLLIILGFFVTGSVTTETKISTSQAAGVQAYYLAESGLAEAVWKLKNDPEWKNNFENNPEWSTVYTRNQALYENGSYTIEITNSQKTHAEIIATGEINLAEGKAKRVIKTAVYKATGEIIDALGENSALSDGNIDITWSAVNIYNGGISANGNIIISGELNSEGEVKASGQIICQSGGDINSPKITEKTEVDPMPSISFDDPNDPNSYYNQATVRYTAAEFSNLIAGKTSINFPGPITYVSGNIEIPSPLNMTINGLFVCDGNISIGKRWPLCGNWGNMKYIQINITNPNDIPSGILAKGYIEFNKCLESISGEGLIYAGNMIKIFTYLEDINIIGGLVSRKLDFNSQRKKLNITKNDSVVSKVLSDPEFSSVIVFEHWEEEY